MNDKVSKDLDDLVTKHIVQRQKAINKGMTRRDNVRYVRQVRPLVHPRSAEDDAESFGAEGGAAYLVCSECGANTDLNTEGWLLYNLGHNAKVYCPKHRGDEPSGVYLVCTEKGDDGHGCNQSTDLENKGWLLWSAGSGRSEVYCPKHGAKAYPDYYDAESFEAPAVYRGARPSPSTSATSVNVGTKMRGGNGRFWVCKTYPRGNKRVKRWVLAAEDDDWEIDDRDLWNPEREAIDQIRGNRALREQMEDQGIHIGRHPGYYDDSGLWVEKEGYHDYGGVTPVPLWVQIGIVLGAITGISVAAKKGWLNFGYDEPLPDQNETEDDGEA